MANGREQRLRAELGLFRRGRTWYTHVRVWEADGSHRRDQVSTRCSDIEAAASVARQLQRDAADPDHAAERTATLSQAVALTIAHVEELVAAGRRVTDTLDCYKKHFGHWIRLLEGDPEAHTYRPFKLSALRQRHVDAFITARRGEGVQDVTIAKELCHFGVLLKIAKRAALWRGDIDELLPVNFEPDYEARERWLSMAEVQVLLGKLLPDRAARVALAIAVGANRSEAERVLHDDVDLDRGRVLLRGTKTPDRWRTVIVCLPWQLELLTYAKQHGEGRDGRLFRPWANMWEDIHKACEAAGIEHASSNDLRRTFSHWLRAEGLSLETIAPLMGHSTTYMVQKVYGKFTTDELAARMRAELAHQVRAELAAPGGDCTAGASDAPGPDGLVGPPGCENAEETSDSAAGNHNPQGLSSPARLWPKPRKVSAKWANRDTTLHHAASAVQQPKALGARKGSGS